MTGTGTELDPYIITTRADLEAVNNDLTACYALGADIDLSDAAWIPIGWTDAYDPDLEDVFAGTFDGRHHVIRNMTVTVTHEDGLDFGLFAWVQGTIQDTILCAATLNVTMTGASGCDYALLCGCLSGGTISGCQASGTIHLYGSGVGTDIGGIAGYSSGTITACRSDLTIERHHPTSGPHASQANYVGGIAGELQGAVELSDCQSSLNLVSLTIGSVKMSHIGGILGAFSGDGGSVSNCRATISLVQHVIYTGTYLLSVEEYVGGIVGASITPTTTDRSTVADCYASGELGTSSYAGGIVGSAANIDVVRCGADVDIIAWGQAAGGGQYIGGACGYGGPSNRLGTLTDCYALGAVSAVFSASPGFYWYGAGFCGLGGTLTRCYAAGKVEPLTAYAGTFGGFCSQGSNTVTDCYFDTETTGQTAGMGTGKTTAEMQTQGTFTNWDFATVWNIASGTYPFLRSAFVVIADGCGSLVHSFPWLGRFQLAHVTA